MGRKKRSGFGDVLTERAAFERGEARCPNCHRPIGPDDKPAFVQAFGGAQSRLATMQCGRCNAMLTVRLTDGE
ncbi:MAG TPA: hypothetical protein VF998_07910 [Candidatus Limnocylindria bacterium]